MCGSHVAIKVHGNYYYMVEKTARNVAFHMKQVVGEIIVKRF